MKKEYVCDICGKQLKNASGLAGHKMLSHQVVREQTKTNPPEEALVEISGDVKRSMERLESHTQELQGQLHTANGKFDDLRESMFERLQEETEARAKAESATQAAQSKSEPPEAAQEADGSASEQAAQAGVLDLRLAVVACLMPMVRRLLAALLALVSKQLKSSASG